MIKLEHINKTFEIGGKTVQAVKDVSLKIRQGEIFGIIGFPAPVNPLSFAALIYWKSPKADGLRLTTRRSPITAVSNSGNCARK